jgi:hypothetical protein
MLVAGSVRPQAAGCHCCQSPCGDQRHQLGMQRASQQTWYDTAAVSFIIPKQQPFQSPMAPVESPHLMPGRDPHFLPGRTQKLPRSKRRAIQLYAVKYASTALCCLAMNATVAGPRVCSSTTASHRRSGRGRSNSTTTMLALGRRQYLSLPSSAGPPFGLRIKGQGRALMPDTEPLTVEAFSAKPFPMVRPCIVIIISSTRCSSQLLHACNPPSLVLACVVAWWSAQAQFSNGHAVCCVSASVYQPVLLALLRQDLLALGTGQCLSPQLCMCPPWAAG